MEVIDIIRIKTAGIKIYKNLVPLEVNAFIFTKQIRMDSNVIFEVEAYRE